MVSPDILPKTSRRNFLRAGGAGVATLLLPSAVRATDLLLSPPKEEVYRLQTVELTPKEFEILGPRFEQSTGHPNLERLMFSTVKKIEDNGFVESGSNFDLKISQDLKEVADSVYQVQRGGAVYEIWREKGSSSVVALLRFKVDLQTSDLLIRKNTLVESGEHYLSPLPVMIDTPGGYNEMPTDTGVAYADDELVTKFAQYGINLVKGELILQQVLPVNGENRLIQTIAEQTNLPVGHAIVDFSITNIDPSVNLRAEPTPGSARVGGLSQSDQLVANTAENLALIPQENIDPLAATIRTAESDGLWYLVKRNDGTYSWVRGDVARVSGRLNERLPAIYANPIAVNADFRLATGTESNYPQPASPEELAGMSDTELTALFDAKYGDLDMVNNPSVKYRPNMKTQGTEHVQPFYFGDYSVKADGQVILYFFMKEDGLPEVYKVGAKGEKIFLYSQWNQTHEPITQENVQNMETGKQYWLQIVNDVYGYETLVTFDSLVRR